MQAFLDMVMHHLTAAGFGGGVLIVALISCLPAKRPRSVDDWYSYFREALQTAIPAARHHQDPQQPEGPAKVIERG